MADPQSPGVRLEVLVHRVDPTLPLPAYATPGSVGFDLLCRAETTVPPGAIALLPSNLIIHTPPGYALLIAPRSSTARRTGLDFPHSLGVIDQDYRGPDDEVMIQVRNTRAAPVVVARGERIAQGLFVPVALAQWREMERPDGPSRGGFGSS
jgi:dUTP pyrophosphatase